MAAVVARSAEQGGAGQLYASRDGAVIADVAWGSSVDGHPVATDSIVPWASAVKPMTCAVLARLWERGMVSLDDRVANHVAGFEVAEKGDVRIRHLLTHTAHLGGYDGPAGLGTWDETIARIVSAPRQPVPDPPRLGTTPGYNPAGIWIVAEICCRLLGQPFADVIRDEVFAVCAMDDAWCGMPRDRFLLYGTRVLRWRIGGRPMAELTEEAAERAQPAGGGVGPIRQLARFYEVMLAGGRTDHDTRLLTEPTVEAMTSTHTPAGPMGAWGLGFSVNSSPPTRQQAPESRGGGVVGFGAHASFRAFGHGGATGVVAMADPEHGLALAAIGAPPIRDAFYRDLGLADGGGASG